MKPLNQNAITGLALISVGIGLTVVLQPWFIGLACFIMGAGQVFTGLPATSDEPDETD